MQIELVTLVELYEFTFTFFSLFFFLAHDSQHKFIRLNFPITFFVDLGPAGRIFHLINNYFGKNFQRLIYFRKLMINSSSDTVLIRLSVQC